MLLIIQIDVNGKYLETNTRIIYKNSLNMYTLFNEQIRKIRTYGTTAASEMLG